MRIHVLGLGSIGTLISHHLRLENPALPISLIFKKAARKQDFRLRSLRLFPNGHPSNTPIVLQVERGGQKVESGGFQAEVWHDGNLDKAIGPLQRKQRQSLLEQDGYISTDSSSSSASDETPTGVDGVSNDDPIPGFGYGEGQPDPPNGDIQSLIVCLKGPVTSHALSVLAPRLSRSSVVTLIQNGMGVYEELCDKIWPNPKDRPHFIIGTTTHGAAPTPGEGIGSVTHNSPVGTGHIKFGVQPDPREKYDIESWLWGSKVGDLPILAPPSSPSLPLPAAPDASLVPLRETLSALLSLSQLSPSLLPMPHLDHERLLKVALNSLINPLTAVFGAGALPNGTLLHSKSARAVMHRLAVEASDAITAWLLSEYADSIVPSDVVRIFSADSLVNRALELVQNTFSNTSSMATDVRKARITEVMYMNGYIMSLGQRYGVATPCHEMMVHMVEHTVRISGAVRDPSPLYAENRTPKLEAQRQKLELINTLPFKINDARIELEEQKLDVKQREIQVEEATLLESKRQERRKARHQKMVELEAIWAAEQKLGPGSPFPTVAEWKRMSWKTKIRAIKAAQLRGVQLELEPGEDSQAGSASKVSDQSAAAIGNDSGSNTETAQRSQLQDEQFASTERSLEPPLSRVTPDPSISPVTSVSDPTSRSASGPAAATPVGTVDKSTSQPTSTHATVSSSVHPASDTTPPTASASSPSPTQPSSSSSAPSTGTYKAPRGLGTSLDSMIASAPRQERTWEVFTTPPTSRGPLPKKRPAKSTTAPAPAPASASSSTVTSAPTLSPSDIDRSTDVAFPTPTPPSLKVLVSDSLSSRLVTSQSPDPTSTSSSPSGPSTSLREATKAAAAAAASGRPLKPMKIPQPRTKAVGGLASLMDSMINSAPRQERTWEVPITPPPGTPSPRKDGKKASISYRQGS